MDSVSLTGLFWADFQTVTTQFQTTYFQTVGPQVERVHEGVALLWLTWKAFQVVAGRAFNLEEAVTQLLWFMVTIAALQTGAIWTDAYSLISSMGVQAAAQAMTIGGGGTVDVHASTIADMVQQTEKVMVTPLLQPFRGMWAEMSIMGGIAKTVAILLLTVVYAVLFWHMIRGFFASFLKVFAVGLLAPFVLAFAAYPATRGTLAMALKMLVTASLQLVLAGGVAGVVMMMFNKLVSPDRLDAANASGFLGSLQYLNMLIGGGLLIVSYNTLLAAPGQLLQVIDQRGGGGGFRMPRFRPPKPAKGKQG